MSFECGFFNSINGDRKYNAEQMNNPYHRIVSNGVFANPDGTPSTDFQVVELSGMTVKVKTGEGIFGDKWAKLDADYPIEILTAHVTNPRIDSIIIRIDTTEEVRAGSIVYREGEPASNPEPPELENSAMVHEYRLANIRVNANAGTITQANITDTRPSEECGFITHLLKQADISATYVQWQAQFEAWFQNVKETLSTATLIRSYTSQYVTATDGEQVIPIQISQYNQNLDILQVFVNGLRLIPNVEYTIDSNSQITLAKDLKRNNPVAFVVYKSVDGSDAETVVQQVYELQQIQVTANGGGVQRSVPAGGDVLENFIDLGSGFHTLYAPSSATNLPKSAAFRLFGHMTSASVGWLVAMQADGSVYANYNNSGTWTGWKTLHEANATALYYSAAGVFPTAGTAVTPSKPLNECQHGWQLVFCGYDDDAKASRDVYVQTYEIPKKNHKQANWNGESVSIPLIYQYVTESDSSLMCQKTLTIYNDRLVGGTTASTGKQRNMVLKAVYEY